MDRNELTTYEKKLGASILRDLDADGFPVSAALWFWNVDTNMWLYMIASPLVDVVGPKVSYTRLSNVLNGKADVYEQILELDNVSIVSNNSSLIQLMKIAIRTEPNSISGIDFTRNTINNHFIEAAYIYRMA